MAVGTRPEFDYPLAARVAPPTFAPLWMALSSKLSRPPPGRQGPLWGSYPSKTPARIKVAFGSNLAARFRSRKGPFTAHLSRWGVVRRRPANRTHSCHSDSGAGTALHERRPDVQPRRRERVKVPDTVEKVGFEVIVLAVAYSRKSAD